MEILGFIVLSMPLLLIVAWLIVSVLIAMSQRSRFKSGIGRKVKTFVLFSLVFLVPFGDEITGRLYHSYICSTEAGYEAFKAVELTIDYWDKEGRPRYLASNGFVDMSLLPDRFKWRRINEPYIDIFITIRKWRWQLIDNTTQVVLGERVTYMREYGWINSFSPTPNIGKGCEFDVLKARQQERDFFAKIIRPLGL